MTQSTKSSKIQIFWENFLKAKDLTYEHSVWFDGFLTEFLVQYKNGYSVEEILSFIPLAGVGTIIGCELLSDIHQICSQPGDGEDLAPLRRHLLRGRGWRTLAVLYYLGVQDVSCGTELATLLVSLYPVCLQSTSSNASRKSGIVTFNTQTSPLQSQPQKNFRNPYVSLKSSWTGWTHSGDQSKTASGVYSNQGLRGYALPGLVRVSPGEGSHFRKWSNTSRPPSGGVSVPQSPRSDQTRSHSSSSNAKHKCHSQSTESSKGQIPTLHGDTSESDWFHSAPDLLRERSNTLKIRLNPMDFDYFESAVRSDDDDDPAFMSNNRRAHHSRFSRRESSKLIIEDLIDEAMREVRVQTISSAELCLLIVHLVEELCRAELPLSTRQVSLQAVNFALENLCSLQFGSAPVEGFGVEEILELKLGMAQLLLTALDKVLHQPELLNQLINAGVLPMMLRVLEDAVSKADALTKSNDAARKQMKTAELSQEPGQSNGINKKESPKSLWPENSFLDEASGLQEFVMAILYGAVTFLHCLLLHRNTTERIHEFEEQFRLFASSHGSRLIEKIVAGILNCSSSTFKPSVVRAKKVVSLVAQLILSLKRARSTIVHSLQCRKTRHKQCKAVNARRHHHNDLFGNPLQNAAIGGIGNQNTICNVAYLFSCLVHILNTNNHVPDFVIFLMKEMLHCGTCCCYPPQSLISCLTKVLHLGGPKARTLAFTLLESTIFSVLGANETDPAGLTKAYFSCSLCNRVAEPLSTQSSVLEDDYTSDYRESGRYSVSSAYSNKSENIDLKNGYWSCLDFYREILCSKDPKLCHTAATHLLKLSANCNDRAQLALLSYVFYPSFLHAKERYLTDQSELSKFIVQTCLSAISCLICSLPLAEVFLSLGGLQHILDLFLMAPFLRLCCSIIEVAIVVNILDRDTAVRLSSEKKEFSSHLSPMDFSQYRNSPATREDLFNLLPLCKLIDSLETSTKELMEKVVNNWSEETVQINRDDLKLIRHVAIFWQTIANLALCSPQLRPFIAAHPASVMGFKLVQVILQRMVHKMSCFKMDAESTLYLRLIESILVVHFTAPPVIAPSDTAMSREKLAEELQSALSCSQITSYYYRNFGCLHLFCDTVIRCALVEASPTQVMPAPRKAEVPALEMEPSYQEEVDDIDERSMAESNKGMDSWTSSDCSFHDSRNKEEKMSDAGSSLEDPYVTADEGYEADIEVFEDNKCRISVVYDSSNSSSVGDQQARKKVKSVSGPKVEVFKIRKHTNTIVHPKLCCLAVNILTNFYRCVNKGGFEDLTSEADENKNKDSKSKEESEKHEEEKRKKKTSKIENDIQVWILPDMVKVLQRLISLCQQSGHNCMVLSQAGLLTILLTNFSDALSSARGEIRELQSVLLELINLLAQHSITSKELALYLRFFKAENPPLEPLLQPLTTLAISARPQPNYILCFPVAASADSVEQSAPVSGYSGASRPSSPPLKNRQRKTSRLFALAASISSSHKSTSQKNNNSNNGDSYSESHHSSSGKSSNETVTSLALSIRNHHIASGTISSWTESALAFPIDNELGWSAMPPGFSVSLWLRVEKGSVEDKIFSHQDLRTPNKSHLTDSMSDSWSEWGVISSASWMKDGTGCKPSSNAKLNRPMLHLVSVGAEKLLLEIWCDACSETLCFKLSQTDGKKYDVVSKSTLSGIFSSGIWHHLAINVLICAGRKQSVLKVTTIVDGLHVYNNNLPFCDSISKKFKPTCLLLGHCTSPAVSPTLKTEDVPNLGSWYLGSLQLFQSPVFTPENAVFMVGLGPSLTSLTVCRVGRDNPNFTGIFRSKTLKDRNFLEAVMDNGSSKLKVLQDNLFLSYSAQYPSVVNVYPQVVGSLGGGMASLFPTHPGFRVVTEDQRASQQLPLTLQPLLFAPLNTQQYRGFVSAVAVLGGVPVFLFLFARVVELRRSEIEQAKTLYLLLKLIQSDAQLFSQFVQQDCHKLLLKVLSSTQCIPGHHVLKAVLDVCCDKPVIQHESGPQCQFVVVKQSEAIVVNSFLLSTILASWRDWERVSVNGELGVVLGTLFEAFCVLLRDDHPFREFNAAQLNRVKLVEALLLFCKERFELNDKPLRPSVCTSLVTLVRSLMGAPPEISHIKEVFDCLLLLHPASATYITHVRPSSYFLLSPTPPAPSPQPYSRPRARSSIFWFGDTESKYLSQMKKLEARGQKDALGFMRPVDPGKLNKALTNLQIKTEVYRSVDDSDIPNPSSHRNSVVFENNKVEKGVSALDAEPRKRHSGNVKSVNFEKESLHMDEKDTCDSNLEQEEFVEDDENEKFSRDNCSREKQSTSDDQNPNTSEDKKEMAAKSLSLVVEGLLTLLSDNLKILPDNMVPQVLNNIIQFETLLVMANNSDGRVRAAVVMVLRAYLRRASPEDVKKFIKSKGYYQLANQIGLHPVTEEVFNACFSLVTSEIFTVTDDNLAGIENMLCEEYPEAYPPLLSFLPRSLHDISLFRKPWAVITISCRNSPAIFLSLIKAGLVEVTLKTMVLAAHQPHAEELLPELTEPWISLFSDAIFVKNMNFSQFLNDIVLQMMYLEQLETSSCGATALCVDTLRRTVCSLLHSSLSQVPHLSYFLDSDEEMIERVKAVVVKAVDLCVNSEPYSRSIITTGDDESFSQKFLSILMEGVICDSSVRQFFRMKCAHMFLWMLAPWQPVSIRMCAINSFNTIREESARELLAAVFQSHSQDEQKFTVFLWALLHGPGSEDLTAFDRQACEQFKEHAQMWGFLSPHAVGHAYDNWSGDVALLLSEAERQRAAYSVQNRFAIERSVHKMESLQTELVDGAMTSTRKVVDAQNFLRKAFMEHIKSTYSENVQLKIKWQRIIQLLTHERAVWYFPESYPMSWRLDATEGPLRVRKRLQRCHLNVKEKFVLPEHRSKLAHSLKQAPLSFLFELDWNLSSTSSVMIEKLHTNEKIQHMCTATVIAPACEVPGELLIGESCLYFVADDKTINDLSKVSCGSLDMSSTAWQFDDVQEIINRRYELQERALEIFLVNGRTYLIAFETAEDRDSFLSELSQCMLVNLKQGDDSLSDVVEMWREGTITNWEYLVQLNKMAGRSYNDLMQYPVFPFILSDYTSGILDLNNPQSFRNLAKPVAVQNKCNEQHYINQYNQVPERVGDHGLEEPYHYGSHYSNSGIVLHFLVRLPPFTHMFLEYQDKNFDLPDRTFHCLHTTWRLSSADSTTDVKELIPEFFFLPEFLLNNEGFDFGVRQCGEPVDSVELPAWSNSDARLFVLIHRQALEAPYVRENLPHWIDLVFGFKQTGKAAVEAINVFHPSTYCGVDISSIEDSTRRLAWQTMVRTYGQMPRQLFRTLHPMAVHSLASRASSSSVPPVLRYVDGLSWGSYVGSPAEPEPVLVSRLQHRTPVANLIALPTNDTFGLAPQTSVLLCYSKEKLLSLGSSNIPQNVALVTWGHADSIVRIKLKKEQTPWPVVRAPELDPICVCASAPNCNQLWMGHISGQLIVYRYFFESSRSQLDFSSEPVTLLGHTAPVMNIGLNRSFSIAVSASQDGTAIIWDLNSLSYVRSIFLGSSVNLVCVSETLGDIVTVCHSPVPTECLDQEEYSYSPWHITPPAESKPSRRLSESKPPSPVVPDDWEVLNENEPTKPDQQPKSPTRSYSWTFKGLSKLEQKELRHASVQENLLSSSAFKSLRPNHTNMRSSTLFLHSVNGLPISNVSVDEHITAVCFSTAPEGLSVNVIATGFFSGVIRLWSSWDLVPVRDVFSILLPNPVISLAYSYDSQHLYASYSDGVLAVWESANTKLAGKTPKFLNLTSL